MTQCPCGSGKAYNECCGPIIAGTTPAPTAEALMRSRYSAYVVADIEHLKNSLAPKKRYDFKEDDVREWAENAEWTGLEITTRSEGGPEDEKGVVEFTARFKYDGEDFDHTEVAEFRRIDGQWYYWSGRVQGSPTVRRETPKVGRNEPCPCGSGKKFKKCCG